HIAARRAAGRPRDHAQRIAGGVATALDLPLVDLLAPARGPHLGLARRAGRTAAHGPPPAGWRAASPPPSTCPWSTCWPRPAATTSASPAALPAPVAHPRPRHPPQAGVAPPDRER